MKRLLLVIAFCSVWSPGAGIAAPENDHQAGPADIDFSRDIAPILAANCFECHGPDSNKRKAGHSRRGVRSA